MQKYGMLNITGNHNTACILHGIGVRMKNRLYYILYLLYAIVVAFVLYINGVFTGEAASVVNLAIVSTFFCEEIDCIYDSNICVESLSLKTKIYI